MTDGINPPTLEEPGVFNKLIELLFSFMFIFFPLIGYIAQYIKIKNLKNSYGFSKLISFILIIAFLFRIFFWFGNHYQLSILFQAIVGLIFQIILLHQCIKYSDLKDKPNSDLFNLNEFWNWPYFMDYIACLVFISTALSLTSFTFGYNNQAYIELLGYISGSVEATLGVPQVISNYSTKNTKGFSLVLIATWVGGDSFKLIFYYYSNSPIQLIMSSVGQLTVDFVILYQMWYYNRITEKIGDNATKQISISN
jgi:hypothetical protein